MTDTIHFYNRDCMEAMKEFPDNYFGLAIVDPPYGGGGDDNEYKGAIVGRFGGRFEKYHLGEEIKVSRTGSRDKMYREPNRGEENGIAPDVHNCRGRFSKYSKLKQDSEEEKSDSKESYDIRSWDYAPTQEYFTELAMVSKNQVIWGGNYFELPPTRCFLIWRKTNIPKDFSMAMVEYAWTSFNDNAKMMEFSSAGTKENPRIHPCEKPIKLYQWILERFAHEGDKILDTHVGSGNSLIACARMGFECWGYEIDKTYYKLASEHIDKELRQGTLF